MMENKAILKRLLPKISPNTKSLFLTNNVAVKAVNNSGNEVVAAKRIPPKRAPLKLVFLSNKSTKVDNLMEKMTTATATTRYEMILTGYCHIIKIPLRLYHLINNLLVLF